MVLYLQWTPWCPLLSVQVCTILTSCPNNFQCSSSFMEPKALLAPKTLLAPILELLLEDQILVHQPHRHIGFPHWELYLGAFANHHHIWKIVGRIWSLIPSGCQKGHEITIKPCAYEASHQDILDQGNGQNLLLVSIGSSQFWHFLPTGG